MSLQIQKCSIEQLLRTCQCVFVYKSGQRICHSYSYGVRAVIQCLPAWFRFVQCLRRYRDTKRAFPHLVNAGKYSTTFFVVIFAALFKTHSGKHTSCYILTPNIKCFRYYVQFCVYPTQLYCFHSKHMKYAVRHVECSWWYWNSGPHTEPWGTPLGKTYSPLLMISYVTFALLPLGDERFVFLYIMIACKVVNSCYTLLWDLKMDWGLFDRNAGENTLLREEIVYPQKVRTHTFSFQWFCREQSTAFTLAIVLILMCSLSTGVLLLCHSRRHNLALCVDHPTFSWSCLWRSCYF